MKIRLIAISSALSAFLFLEPVFAYLPSYYSQTSDFIKYIDSVRIWFLPVLYIVISVEAFALLSLCAYVQKETVGFLKKYTFLGTVLLLNFFLYGDSYTQNYSGYFSKLRSEPPIFLGMVDWQWGFTALGVFLGILTGSFAIGFLLSKFLLMRILFKNPKNSAVFIFTIFLGLFLFTYFGGIITQSILLRILEFVYPFSGERYLP